VSVRILAAAAMLGLATANAANAAPPAATPHVQEFGATFGSSLVGIGRARDGSVWVGEGDRVARVTRDGRVREYRVPVTTNERGTYCGGPVGLGPGGDMWFGCSTYVARISRDGRFRLYAKRPSDRERSITAFSVSRTAVAFAETSGSYPGAGTARIVRLNADGKQTASDSDLEAVNALAFAADGALWIASSARSDARFVTMYRRPPGGERTKITEITGLITLLGTTPAGGLVTAEFSWQPPHAHVAILGSDGHNANLVDYDSSQYFVGSGGIAYVRDGAAWLTEPGRNRLAHVARDGVVREARRGLPDIAAPNAIVADDAGGAWFTDVADGIIGHVDANGSIRTLGHGPLPDSSPAYPVVASDGAVWFRETFAWRRRLTRLAPDGSVREFHDVGDGPLAAHGREALTSTSQGIVAVAPDGAIRTVVPIVAATFSPHPAAPANVGFSQTSATTIAPDGAAWLAGNGEFARIDRNGAVRRIHTRAWNPGSIAFDARGTLWFTDTYRNAIGSISPNGRLRTYTRGLTRWHSGPQWIAPGPDGAMWFTEVRDRIGRIAPDGRITEFSRGIPRRCSLGGIAAGPDGALWFTLWHGNVLGRMTTDGRVTLHRGLVSPSRGHEYDPDAVLVPDGHGGFWFNESQGGRLAHLTFR
jgi:streptogramin lyase